MNEPSRVVGLKNAVFGLILLSMLLFAGCAGLGDNSTTKSSSSGSMAAGVAPGAVPSYEFAPSSATPSDQIQQVIQQASASVEVPAGTLQARYSQFKQIITSEGGQIISADYSEGDSSKEYNIEAKIPPQKFEDISMQLQGVGSVKSMDTNIQDVSDQYVDIQTRIKNLQIQKAELFKLYDRNGTLDDALAVENEINRVQTDIELYQNQQLSMDRQIAMSSVSVRLYEQAPLVNHTVLDLLGDVANTFLGALGFAIVAVSAILGFGIPVAIVGGILYLLYRRFIKKKEAPQKKGNGKK